VSFNLDASRVLTARTVRNMRQFTRPDDHHTRRDCVAGANALASSR